MRMSEREAFAILGIKTLTVCPPLLEKAYDQALCCSISDHDPQGSASMTLIHRAYQVLSEEDTQKKPRFYVVCAASYAQGKMHGRWIDPMQAPELMQAQIAEMISESPTPHAKDWAIHHTEGFGYKGTFHDELDILHEKARFISAYGALGLKLLDRYNDPQRAYYMWDEHYHGVYESKMDFAIGLCSEYSHQPLIAQLKNHVDYKGLSESLFEKDYFFIALPEGLHVFTDR